MAILDLAMVHIQGVALTTQGGFPAFPPSIGAISCPGAILSLTMIEQSVPVPTLKAMTLGSSEGVWSEENQKAFAKIYPNLKRLSLFEPMKRTPLKTHYPRHRKEILAPQGFLLDASGWNSNLNDTFKMWVGDPKVNSSLMCSFFFLFLFFSFSFFLGKDQISFCCLLSRRVFADAAD
jgi:hypothetical protein